MKQAKWICVFGLAFITLTICQALAAQNGDTSAIQQKLSSQIKLTITTADRSDIATAGDVVALHRPGLLMYAVSSPLPPSNSYKNGKIGQGWGGFGRDLLITMATPGAETSSSYPQRQFAPEEKCWVTGIQVQKDGVLFQLYSDPYDGIRYYANLKIPFPNKKQVPPVDVAMQTVAEVLTVVPPDQGGQGNQPSPGMNAGQNMQEPPPFGMYFLKETGASLHLVPDGSFVLIAANGQQSPGTFAINGNSLSLTYSATGRSSVFAMQGDRLVANTGLAWVRQADAPAPAAEAAPQPPPAPMPAIAPPPPPADAPPPTISLGETMSQVIAGFGQPQKEVKLGVKVIFYYKDMKVIFTNGKVSNVD